MESENKNNYHYLVNRISETYIVGQRAAVIAVNIYLVDTYWKIGQQIVEFEQGGGQRAEYGKLLLNNLAKDLSANHGIGFSRSNLIYMRLFYLEFPISEKASHLLSI
jgi:uncharacterized protein DUF1016